MIEKSVEKGFSSNSVSLYIYILELQINRRWR